MKALVRRFRELRDKRSFDCVGRQVLSTAPLQMRGGGPLFLTMLRHSDVIMYLLAIKSLYVRIGFGKVVIINDGSLTAGDLAILNFHIPMMGIIELKDINIPSCPRADFFWERLVKIVQLSENNYVIQLDADTLVSATIPEVVQLCRENRSFLLGTASGQRVSPAPETAQMVQEWIRVNGWTNVPV